MLPLVFIGPLLLQLVEKYRNYGEVDSAQSRQYYGSITDGSACGDIDIEMEGVDSGGVGGVSQYEEAPLVQSRQPKQSTQSRLYEEKYTMAPIREHPVEEEVPLSIREQVDQIWSTVQRVVVFGPLSFVYVYNILQVPNVAWQSYLQLALEFPPSVLGITVTLGSFMTLIGILAYKKYFFGASWRNIYIWSTVLTSFFSITQIMLIFKINTKYLGINNYFFSVGDDVIQQFISGVQFLPVCILYMRLCPEGSEGASYSMLTTFGNIALVCANNVGNWLSHIWDVSNTAMRAHDYTGLWKLTVLTSVVSVVPLVLLDLLPKNTAEQEALGRNQDRNKVGGALFLGVLFASIFGSLVAAFQTVYGSEVSNHT